MVAGTCLGYSPVLGGGRMVSVCIRVLKEIFLEHYVVSSFYLLNLSLSSSEILHDVLGVCEVRNKENDASKDET